MLSHLRPSQGTRYQTEIMKSEQKIGKINAHLELSARGQRALRAIFR